MYAVRIAYTFGMRNEVYRLEFVYNLQIQMLWHAAWLFILMAHRVKDELKSASREVLKAELKNVKYIVKSVLCT